MVNDFNEILQDTKVAIQNQCKIFQTSYTNFLPICDEIKFKDGACKDFLNQLNEGNIRIIFCGQVKSGKSRCIIEFLNGEISLPSCDTPITAFFTYIYYDDKQVWYSVNRNNERIEHEFDGMHVGNDFAGPDRTSEMNKADLETIFYVGKRLKFFSKNLIVIDSPGLNESEGIDAAFFINLEKLNPQLVIYIFENGSGFKTDDGTFITKVLGHMGKKRDNLKKIFLFNKFDYAFKEERVITDDPDDISTIEDFGSDYEEDDDDEIKKEEFDEKYKKDYERHKKRLSECIPGESNLILMGYSGKLVQRKRESNENPFPLILEKHIHFLREIQAQINILNIETIEKILKYVESYLFTKFKKVHTEILTASDQDFEKIRLGGEAKKILLAKFDQCHGQLNISPQKVNHMELDNMINEIIEYQVKQVQKTETVASKLTKITESLTQFFSNRYFNLFSNIINMSLDSISFDSLCDEIRNNDLHNSFSHTFCALKHDTDSYNLNSRLEMYFNEQSRHIHNLRMSTTTNFISSESYKQFFKNNLKYDIASILPIIEEYKQVKLDNERKMLENAIDKKIVEVDQNYQATEQETELIIKDNVKYFKTWIEFNNNYIRLLSQSKISDEKKNFFNKIIDGSIDFTKSIEKTSENIYIYKIETVDFDQLSCRNNDIIQYFLRTQTISQYLLSCHLFYHEHTKQMCFLTEITNFRPFRLILPDMDKEQKTNLIQKLISVVESLYINRLPIDNFGPEMIFGKLDPNNQLVVKLTETSQKFHNVTYILHNGEQCDQICFRFKFHNSYENTIGGRILSMFHAFGWILLIIINGNCEKLITNEIFKDKFRSDINRLFTDQKSNKIYQGAKAIIERCRKERIDNVTLSEIAKEIRKLKDA